MQSLPCYVVPFGNIRSHPSSIKILLTKVWKLQVFGGETDSYEVILYKEKRTIYRRTPVNIFELSALRITLITIKSVFPLPRN